MAFIVTGAYGKPLAKAERLAPSTRHAVEIRVSSRPKGIQHFIFTDERPKTYWMALWIPTNMVSGRT